MKYKVGDRVKWNCFKYRVIGYKFAHGKIVTVIGESGRCCNFHEEELKPIITLKAELG